MKNEEEILRKGGREDNAIHVVEKGSIGREGTGKTGGWDEL